MAKGKTGSGVLGRKSRKRRGFHRIWVQVSRPGSAFTLRSGPRGGMKGPRAERFSFGTKPHADPGARAQAPSEARAVLLHRPRRRCQASPLRLRLRLRLAGPNGGLGLARSVSCHLPPPGPAAALPPPTCLHGEARTPRRLGEPPGPAPELPGDLGTTWPMAARTSPSVGDRPPVLFPSRTSLPRRKAGFLGGLKVTGFTGRGGSGSGCRPQ